MSDNSIVILSDSEGSAEQKLKIITCTNVLNKV